jgi:phage/plasmid-associated DNA primase
LAPELDGILAWLVDGLRDFYARGNQLDPPDSVTAATAAWRADMDLVARWVEEEVELHSDGLPSTSELWLRFDQFAARETAGKHPMNRADFQKRFEKLTHLQEIQPRDGETRRRGYRGIRLKQSVLADI